MKQDISKIHLEILDSKRQKVLLKIASLVHSFVLSGGTALALQIKHRQSFDFDFFSSRSIKRNLLEKIKKVINIKAVSVDTGDELSIYTDSEVSVTFLYYPYKNLTEFITTKEKLNLYALKDIAAQKAYTIGRRGKYRDYFDVYTLLKEKYFTLTEIISLAEKIYGNVFNPKLFLQQLVYFGDIDNFEIIPINKNEQIPSFNEVRDFLQKSVRDFLKESN